MIVQAQGTQTQENQPGTSWDRDTARVLALFEDNRDNAFTIADLRELGIHAPGQVIYALQLAGYDIDRAPVRRPGGTRGYRLRTGDPTIDRQATAPHRTGCSHPDP